MSSNNLRIIELDGVVNNAPSMSDQDPTPPPPSPPAPVAQAPVAQAPVAQAPVSPAAPVPTQSASIPSPPSSVFSDGSSSSMSVAETDNESGTESDDDVEQSDQQGGGKSSSSDGTSDSASDSTSTCSTSELLSADPLYFVMSRFLMNEDGQNIVHVLEKINNNLKKIAKSMHKK